MKLAKLGTLVNHEASRCPMHEYNLISHSLANNVVSLSKLDETCSRSSVVQVIDPNIGGVTVRAGGASWGTGSGARQVNWCSRVHS